MDSSLPVGYPQTAAEIAAGITPTNYGYPELYFERYGGSVSATSTVNDTAMTSALSVAVSRVGGILYFPSAGTYAFSNTTAFSLPQSLIIQGTGAETILSYSGTGTFLIIPSGSPGGRNEIRDILLLGPGGGMTNSASNNTGTCLQIGDSNGSQSFAMMRRVTITGFALGMRVGGLTWGRFEMCEFGNATGGSTGSVKYSNNVGVDFNFAASTNQVYAVTFSDCIVSNNANAGVQATSTPITMNSIRWNGCTIQNNCQNATTNPQFYMGDVEGFEILGLYMEYVNGGTAPEAIRSDNLSNGIIADFYIQTCAYGIHDHGGGSMNQVDIVDGIIGGVVTAPIYAASEHDVVARNVDVSGAVTLTGTGCSYLPLGSGLASWPATDVSFSPTLTGTGGAATYTGTGGYSKVGNIVNFNLSIVTSASTLTGPIQVGSLPINATSTPASTLSAIFVVQCIGITPSGGNNQFYGKLAAGSGSIAIWGGGTSAPAQVQGSALAAVTTINITGSYQAAS